ncbi:sigma-70 family RNA polymerase sigma factor [Patescibacteria group bacterium]|nr:sigma-70 family RNA polymerase sigma factor [Patescibacteria group bacterium]MBU4367960.1 sigma-70 family RNA polymerase sigma factor [Patescibacteria group bacterium]MBU4462141.1 sigma-70 family RNA polymerase sigma factor [Patescibacteria group bacterium]MCG2699803.1 sigma-70 family RNA polymerase sigma factor [Candidatus Parcubacteria bacterium]
MEKNNKNIPDKAIQMYLKEIEKISVANMSEKEEKELFKKIERGDDGACQHIGNYYLKLVVRVAEYYLSRTKNLTFLDLIQEGNLGLFKALKSYDWMSDYKFSTLAILSIRKSILRALTDPDRTIRIPVYTIVMTSKYLKTKKNLLQKLNREPTVEEIALEMEVNVDQVHQIIETYYRKKEIPHDYLSKSLETPLFKNIKGELVIWEKLTNEDKQEIRKKDLEEVINNLKMNVKNDMSETIELICKVNNISDLEAREQLRKIFNQK